MCLWLVNKIDKNPVILCRYHTNYASQILKILLKFLDLNYYTKRAIFPQMIKLCLVHNLEINIYYLIKFSNLIPIQYNYI